MDAVGLSRLQFGLTISFHYVFPPITIGLGLILVIMEALYLRTKNPLYLQMTKFWVKVFALVFSIGVATGIVMEFQFGTNWAAYSRYVGDVFGSALAAEGVFAFFLESGFLALLIFGWDRIGPKLHFFATLMVSLGSMFSAIWIVVADSWMQTPAGFHIVPGPGGLPRAEVTDFWQVVFNPSSMDRLWHTLMGAWQAGAWLVASVAAYYLLRRRHLEFAKASLKVALSVALLASVLQLLSGHDSGKYVAQHQPEKLAAYEGHWKTGPAGLYLLGWYVPPMEGVKDAEGVVRGGVMLPGMLSWLVYGSASHPVTGLQEFIEKGQPIPPVNVVFQTYHLMVGIGMSLIALSLLGVLFWLRGTLWEKRWYLWLCVLAVILPQAANQLGWISAEVGRQPWIVYRLMRTAAGVSPRANPGQILASLILFVAIYLLLTVLFFYLLNHKIQHGPEEEPRRTTPSDTPPRNVPLLQGDRAGT